MEIIRTFWEVAAEDDPSIADLPEVQRYAFCEPEAFRQLFAVANLEAIEVAGLEAPAVFEDFDDYWQPFLGGQGTAPTYVASLSDESRALPSRSRRTDVSRFAFAPGPSGGARHELIAEGHLGKRRFVGALRGPLEPSRRS